MGQRDRMHRAAGGREKEGAAFHDGWMSGAINAPQMYLCSVSREQVLGGQCHA